MSEHFKIGFQKTVKNFFNTEFDNPFFKKHSEQPEEIYVEPMVEKQAIRGPNPHECEQSSSHEVNRTHLNRKKDSHRAMSRDKSCSNEEESDNNMQYAHIKAIGHHKGGVHKRDHSASNSANKSLRYSYTSVNNPRHDDDEEYENNNGANDEFNGIYSANFVKNRNNKLNTIIWLFLCERVCVFFIFIFYCNSIYFKINKEKI